VADPTQVALKLAREVERQLEIQAKLGEALLTDLEKVKRDGRPVFDVEGNVVNTSYVPDRDWARCYGHYKSANKDLLAEQRERSKLQMLAQNSGSSVLSDEQYAEELRQLALESVKQLSDDELEAEINARGLAIEDVQERDE
jgi:hypothetical protein